MIVLIKLVVGPVIVDHCLQAARLRSRLDQAFDPFQRAMRLSPHEPLTYFFCYFFALAEYHQRHYEEAVKIANMGIGIRPAHMLHRTLAASYGQLGRFDEAKSALVEMRRLMPASAERLWEIASPYLDPEHRARLVGGLQKAGWAV